MKWLLRSIPILALSGISCSAPSTTVVNSLAPTVTRFSPDTIWTFQPLTIYGTGFGYDYQGVRVTIDTAHAQIMDVEDTMVIVTVPEGARTGPVHVWAYEQTATSAKAVVINYVFSPHTIADTVSDGHSFSIPGTGMNNARGILRLYVSGIAFPIDSVFPDRIVSHVVPNSVTGQVTMSDSNGTHDCGTLVVTSPCFWRTLSEIWDNLTVTETHRRTGYINGPANTIDSTWHTTITYSGQHDWNISGTSFDRTERGLTYTFYPIRGYSYVLFQLTWDTVSQTANTTYEQYSYLLPTQTSTIDTQWHAGGQSQTAPLPVDGNIEFALPGYGYRITQDSTDTQGLVNWQESISATVTSGMFDLIFKQ